MLDYFRRVTPETFLYTRSSHGASLTEKESAFTPVVILVRQSSVRVLIFTLSHNPPAILWQPSRNPLAAHPQPYPKPTPISSTDRSPVITSGF